MIVQNMTSNNGNKVPNQFDIQLDGKWFKYEPIFVWRKP